MKKAINNISKRSRSVISLLLAAAFIFTVMPVSLPIFAESAPEKAPANGGQKAVVHGGYYDYNGNYVAQEGVVQGETEVNFAAGLPVATIFINEDVLNADTFSRQLLKED